MTVQSSAKPLDGRVAVIVGASSGIGEAAAEHLAWLGAKVAVVARREGRLEDLVTRIEKNGGSAMGIAADVTHADRLREVADTVEEELGGADLLFNNAGVMLPAPIEELRTDQWQHQIDLNITGLMNAIGAFVPQLVRTAAERGVADLVNTASIAAHNIFPNFAVYCGTKAYVTQLSRNLRTELGAKQVRVSAISPGTVGTELQSHVTDDGAREWLDSSKQTMEWLTPQDIAQIVGFIATLPPRANLQEVIVMPTGQPA
ncbi:SDR family oxidoreductase [Streptosporangium lutulentum]|uniref:NADP-dependent 3-hydroxy acid dehydrogenase YdfG n=1 Tax=Streptosporangium lutulentum TaxID=1461250 RepID=A0ABT9Q5V3_9ACTN|nr:SDR family oxidoreductase [Streptosporangium lutulentum]MDP9842123.1 NADP-dependent 3-hydroxy acid dehydrogenase YdfG [Streptosporangium lutulentum]